MPIREVLGPLLMAIGAWFAQRVVARRPADHTLIYLHVAILLMLGGFILYCHSWLTLLGWIGCAATAFFGWLGGYCWIKNISPKNMNVVNMACRIGASFGLALLIFDMFSTHEALAKDIKQMQLRSDALKKKGEELKKQAEGLPSSK